MSITNVYEYLEEKCRGGILELFSLCGIDTKVCDGASDYDKFYNIYRHMGAFVGNDAYGEINAVLSDYFGRKIDLCTCNPEQTWRAFYENGLVETVEKKTEINIFTPNYDVLHDAIDIRGVTEFISPNPYHVGLARSKILQNIDIGQDEKNMLIIQSVREGVRESSVKIIATPRQVDIITRLTDYLKRTMKVKSVFAIFDGMAPAGDDYRKVLGAGIVSGVILHGENLKSEIESIANAVPIGNIYLFCNGTECDILKEFNCAVEEFAYRALAPKSYFVSVHRCDDLLSFVY